MTHWPCGMTPASWKNWKTPSWTCTPARMLDKLTSQHIEYIMESLSNTTQPIKNIRSYLRVTILRAPTTVEHYYKAQANAAVARAPHPAGPSAEKLAATLRRIQKRGDGA